MTSWSEYMAKWYGYEAIADLASIDKSVHIQYLDRIEACNSPEEMWQIVRQAKLRDSAPWNRRDCV